MMRQVARKSIGGKAPRKQLISKAPAFGFFPSGDSQDSSSRYQVNIGELKTKFEQQDLLLSSNNALDEKELIMQQYDGCEELIKKWINEDLRGMKKKSSETIEEFKDGLLKQLDENTKFEILQYLPTYSSLESKLTIIDDEKQKEEMSLDSEIVTFHKMRLINKNFNKIMMKKILTLKEIVLKTAVTTLNYIDLLSASQNSYKQEMAKNSNYDLNVDNVFLYGHPSVNQDNDQHFGFNSTDYEYHDPNAQYNFGNYGNFSNIIPPGIPNGLDNSDEQLIGKIISSNKGKKNPHKVNTDYMREEITLYTSAQVTNTNSHNVFSIPSDPIINQSIETLTLIVDDQYSVLDIITRFSKLKRLNVFVRNTEPYYGGEIFNLYSPSIEEIFICGSTISEHLANPYSFNSFTGAACPKLRSVTISPLIINPLFPNVVVHMFDQLQNLAPTIKKITVYDKIGKSEKVFINSQLFTPTNQRELDVYFVQQKAFLNIEILEELYEIFGDAFLRNMMHSLLMSSPSSRLPPVNLVEHMNKFKDVVNHFFKNREFPISNMPIFGFGAGSINDVMEVNILDAKLQYLMYICNQYQNSKLLNTSVQQKARPIVSCIASGWNFTKQTHHLLATFVRDMFARGVKVLLTNFNYDDMFIGSQLEYLATSASPDKDVITEILIYLFRKDSKLLDSILVKPIQLESNRTKFTIPLIAFLLNKADSYLISKIINEMDMETFNSIGQNERGDNILHIYIYIQVEFNYLIFYSLLNKNPNLINMVNHKLQSPLHYLMSNKQSGSSLLLPEINLVLKSKDSSVDMDISDYMEQTPRSILKSEEDGDIIM